MNSASVLRIGAVEILFSFDLPVAVSKDNVIVVLRKEDRRFKTNSVHIGTFLRGRVIDAEASADDLKDAITRAMRTLYNYSIPPPANA